jgi:hypothetical protein
MAENNSPRKLFAGAGLAALRQGGKEIGTALKAFPDSISVDEPGGVLSPTQGEVAEQNRTGSVWGRVQQAQEKLAGEAKAATEQEVERD